MSAVPGESVSTVKVRRRAVQQRSVDTRAKIIDAAAMEFAHHGYEGASTRTIANNAQVQHTLVTYHFQSKEGLWRETLDHLTETQRMALEKRLDGLRGVDPSTALYLYLTDFIHFSANHPEYAWIMSHVASKPSEQLDWLFAERLDSGFARMEELIAQAQLADKFIPGDPRYLYYLLIGMVTRIFMLSAEVKKVLGRSPFDPAFVEFHARVCLSFFFRNLPQVEGGAPTVIPKTPSLARKRAAVPN